MTVGATLAGLLLLAQLVALGLLAYAQSRVRRLPGEAPDRTAWPSLSVIFAARDEEVELEGALRSLLASDYPDLEIIAVDDRSADRTPEILARLAAEDSRLKAVRVDELPEGWLGKNHALHAGASRAAGEFLLFTDADVSFSPTALRKAVAACQSEGLNHLAVAPRISSPSLAVNLVVASFIAGFGLFTRVWKVRDPRSRAHIGLGAFNLVRRSAYEAAGGHGPIRLRPDDDLKLGKLLKRAGFRQECISGAEDVRLAWYPTAGAFVRGLEKNVLAGLDYSLSAFIAGVLSLWAMALGPWLLLAFGGPATRILAAGAILASMLGYAGALRAMQQSVAYTPAAPFAQVLLAWTLLRSGVLAYLRGGIIWRGTFYPLATLEKNRVGWTDGANDRDDAGRVATQVESGAFSATGGENMGERNACESCGMPVVGARYCPHCVDEKGELQTFEVRFERMVAWMLSKEPSLPRAEAEKRVREAMGSLPAWKDHPKLKS